jgi:FAD/FMN-containing dehydrogenase
MSKASSSAARLSDLTSALPGKVVLPSHGGWDSARRAWNLAADLRPAAVVYPESAEDIATAVRFAGQRGFRIAPQGTGHNAGSLGGLEDAILVKTQRMRGVVIQAEARTARVDAGVLAGELAEAAAGHGFAAITGTSPGVGVVGYTLGGGIGVLGRRFGLASSRVRAVELVSALGRIVRADRENEQDLFWALRGGGGSFGVVTAMELELLPLSHAYAGTLWFPSERAREVLHAWRELAEAHPPDELTTMGRLLSFPPIPEVPQDVRGKSFVVVHVYHAGDRALADRLLDPLRALRPVKDTIQDCTIPALLEVHMDPDRPVPAVGDGVMLAELTVEALATLIDVAGQGNGQQLATVEVRHLQGELARARPENGALASIPAKYTVYAGGFGPTPDLAASIQERIETLKRALAPWTTRYMNLNFAEMQRDPESFWTEQAYHRLRRIKATADPGNLVLANHPVAPSR